MIMMLASKKAWASQAEKNDTTNIQNDKKNYPNYFDNFTRIFSPTSA